jgi:plasmid replication initiation protein
VTFLSKIAIVPELVEDIILRDQPTRQTIVWQQNRLAEARYKLSPREQKLLLYVIAMIEPESEEFGKCKVSEREYADLTCLKRHSLYEELRDTALSIREKTLVVEDIFEPGMKKPVRRHGSWFEYVEAIGDGHVTIKLSSWLKPFLLRVRREFFKYQLGYAMSLKSEYAIRLYQWLKRWQFVGKQLASVPELRLYLGATEIDHEGKIVRENLALYKHFKNRAICPAVAEINAKTDIRVAFSEVKAPGSKAVSKIAFTIQSNMETRLDPIPLPRLPQLELTLVGEEDVRPLGRLLGEEFGLSQAQVQWLEEQIRTRGEEYIARQAAIVRNAPRKNLAQAFIAAVRDGWQEPKKTAPPSAAKVKKLEPQGWREWLKEQYPGANIPETYAELERILPSVCRELKAAGIG